MTRLSLFSVLSRRHKHVILGLSQWATISLLGDATARLPSDVEIMMHAGRGATRWSHKARGMACIIRVYCFNISETITLTTVCLKSLKMYAAEMRMCKSLGGMPIDCWVTSAYSKQVLFENCLYSPRSLVRGIPTRVRCAPEILKRVAFVISCINS